jgi:hypothetical protein
VRAMLLAVLHLRFMLPARQLDSFSHLFILVDVYGSSGERNEMPWCGKEQNERRHDYS